jgi:hypothetical protein
MKPHHFLIAVSIDEFTCLHDSGCLWVDWNRLTPCAKDTPESSVKSSLLMRLPEFIERDEHNVLLLLFQISGSGADDSSARMRNMDLRLRLLAKDCHQAIPTTTRSKQILESRFAGRILLEDPIFESLFEENFRVRQQERSLFGGNSLIECLVDPAEHRISQELNSSALESLASAGNPVARMVNYQRRDPMPREPISGLRDLGRILTESVPDRKPTAILQRLGDWLKPRKESVVGIRPVYGDSSLTSILDALTAEFSLPTHAAALGIFLHWRELALRAGGLDLESLEVDCRELAGIVAGDRIVDALWLLGFSAGFESFSSDYYSRLGAGHPFGGGKEPGPKIGLLWPRAEVAPRSQSASEEQAAEEQEHSYVKPGSGEPKDDISHDPSREEIDSPPNTETTASEQETAEVTDTQGRKEEQAEVYPPASTPKKPAKKAAKKTAQKKGKKQEDPDSTNGGELFSE